MKDGLRDFKNEIMRVRKGENKYIHTSTMSETQVYKLSHISKILFFHKKKTKAKPPN